ncbi:MAG: sortase [Anaerolineales bacterium]|nr:sortase [Anaerolineales bacterium]
MGTTLFFTANDGVHGEEVWFSEFPYATTHLLKDIRPGINGSVPTHVYGGFTGTLANAIRMGWMIYFTANDGSTGVELWQISTGLLPRTGYAPNVKTAVSSQPAAIEYQSYEQLWLEIPKLSKVLSIIGIPKEGDSWNLDWLGNNEVGYLMGTVFPTLPGNTAITGHVYLPDGSPGPFVDLRELAWDDEIVIHAWGQKYIYKVRYKNEWVDPNDASVLSHKEHDWVTLITCRGFDETSGYYRWRTVVQAILVEIKDK